MSRGYKIEQVLQAIDGSAGIISTIARRLGCAWCTADKWVKHWGATRDALQDELDERLDLAEAQLLKAIEGGDMQAIKFYLATKGKKRGYIERHELTGEDGKPIEHTLYTPKRIDSPEEWQAAVTGKIG